jgi:hypothetical protein
MPQSLLRRLGLINETLFHLLELTRRSLAGQGEFDLELVRKLSAVVSEAAPIVGRQSVLRVDHPALAAPLDHYLRLATDLQSELDKINIMLLSRRATLDASRTQLHAVSQFVGALSSTS